MKTNRNLVKMRSFFNDLHESFGKVLLIECYLGKKGMDNTRQFHISKEEIKEHLEVKRFSKAMWDDLTTAMNEKGWVLKKGGFDKSETDIIVEGSLNKLVFTQGMCLVQKELHNQTLPKRPSTRVSKENFFKE